MRAIARLRSKSEPECRQNFAQGGVCNMMTVPDERAERLAEIFREIFALSETNRPKPFGIRGSR